MKSTTLYFRQGTSDKEYHIQLQGHGSAFIVNFQYGRRGELLKEGTKTPTPVTLAEAEKIYNSLLNEKIKKGYGLSSN